MISSESSSYLEDDERDGDHGSNDENDNDILQYGKRRRPEANKQKLF